MKFKCIDCGTEVNTGISQADYREVVLLGRLSYTCQLCIDREKQECSVPVETSTILYGRDYDAPPVLERSVPVEASTILYGRDYDEPPVLERSVPVDASTIMYGRDYDAPPVLERSVPVETSTILYGRDYDEPPVLERSVPTVDVYSQVTKTDTDSHDGPRILEFGDDSFSMEGREDISDITSTFCPVADSTAIPAYVRHEEDASFDVHIVPAFLKPTGQLLSIHAFVQKDGKSMQFPLVFALMSRRRKDDYVEVFRAVQEKTANLSVEMVTADFEAGIWQAIREVFPTVVLKGCVFHWTKAVWTHVQQLGLVTTFREREATHVFIKQLMALPFLPWTHIPDVFRAMIGRCQPHLRELMTYVQVQWMENQVFPVRSWSVYEFTIRTNNDVEGWHLRTNCKAKGMSLPFYQLIPLLIREAEIVQTRIAASDLEQDTRKRYSQIQRKIEEATTEYMTSAISASHFLKICGNIYTVPCDH